MKRIQLTAIAAILAAGTLVAQGQATTASEAQPAQSDAITSTIPLDQQATKEQIEKIFEVLRLRKQMESMMNMMPRVVMQSFQAQMQSLNAKFPRDKQITLQQRAQFEEVMNRYMDKAKQMYPIDEMLADAAPIYQRHVSKTDADAVIAFYNSPPGQHLLNEQPVIMKEYMDVVMEKVQKNSKQLSDEMTADIQKIVESSIQKTTNPPTHSN